MSLLALLLAQVEIPERRFGLNLDLLNTNLLNIVIVFGLLFWLGRGYLGRILGERRAEIESSIREVEDRGRQAEQELVVARNNLSTAQAQAQQILAEARTNAERVRTQVLDQAQADIARIRDSIEQDLQSEQQRALAQVRLQVIRDALSRLQQRLPGELDEQTQRRLLDQSIQLLD